MIRLIISDIDGTLAPEGATGIHPEYMDVICALRECGVEFAAASGRQASSIDAIFHKIRDKIYYLADNGAYIQRYGVPARETHMELKDTRELIADVRSISTCYSLLSTKDGFYTDNGTPEFHHLIFEEYRGKGGVVKDINDYIESCIKLSLYCHNGAREVYDRLYDRWKDKFILSISGAKWVDINDTSSTKGNAVRWIQETLGISPEETVVFGDNFNDVYMLERSALSYASVLAHPDVKKAARYEVASYEEDGVLRVLKKLVEEIKNEV